MAERTQFVAYVTKYALTAGIKTRVVRDCFHINSKMVADVENCMVCYHGNDWHRTEAEAKERVEQMRLVKIASLEKQLVRLRALKF